MVRDIKYISDLKGSRITGSRDQRLAFGVVVFLVRASFKAPRFISVTDFTSAGKAGQNTPVFHISNSNHKANVQMDVLRDRYNAPDEWDPMNSDKGILLYCQVELSQKNGASTYNLTSFTNLNHYPPGVLSLNIILILKAQSLLTHFLNEKGDRVLKGDLKELVKTVLPTEVVTASQHPQEPKQKKPKVEHLPIRHTPPAIVNPLFVPHAAFMGSQIAVEEQSQLDQLEDDYLVSSERHTEPVSAVVDLTMSEISDISDDSDVEELSESQLAKERRQPRDNASQDTAVISIPTLSTQESHLENTLSSHESREKAEVHSQNTPMSGSVDEQPHQLQLDPITDSQVEELNNSAGQNQEAEQTETQVKQEELILSQQSLLLSTGSQPSDSEEADNEDPRMIERWLTSTESSNTQFSVVAYLIALSPFRPRIIGKSFNSPPGVIPFQLFISNLPRSKIDTLFPDKNCFALDFSTEETIMKFIGFDDIEKAYAANLGTYEKLMTLVQSDVQVVFNITKKRIPTGCWYRDVWECEETLDDILQQFIR